MADDLKTDARQLDQTRNRLLSAAVNLLCRKGYRGATTREIAQEAGVTEVTLYRHFRSKEELFVTAVGEQGQIFLTVVPQPAGDLEADLNRLADGFVQHLSSLPAQLTRIIPELSQQEDLLQALNAITQAFREKVMALFHYYQLAGELRDDADEVLVAAFTGPLHLCALGGAGTQNFDRRRFVTMFLEGWRREENAASRSAGSAPGGCASANSGGREC